MQYSSSWTICYSEEHTLGVGPALFLHSIWDLIVLKAKLLQLGGFIDSLGQFCTTQSRDLVILQVQFLQARLIAPFSPMPVPLSINTCRALLTRSMSFMGSMLSSPRLGLRDKSRATTDFDVFRNSQRALAPLASRAFSLSFSTRTDLLLFKRLTNTMTSPM